MCAKEFENLFSSPEKYDKFIEDTKLFSIQVTLSSVLYLGIIFLEIFSQRRQKVGEYDYIDEFYDPNECGLLNHRIIAFIALCIKVFPLYLDINANRQVSILEKQYRFLFSNDCSDKMTN